MKLAIQDVAREVDFRSSLAADSHSAAKYWKPPTRRWSPSVRRQREARTPERT